MPPDINPLALVIRLNENFLPLALYDTPKHSKKPHHWLKKKESVSCIEMYTFPV